MPPAGSVADEQNIRNIITLFSNGKDKGASTTGMSAVAAILFIQTEKEEEDKISERLRQMNRQTARDGDTPSCYYSAYKCGRESVSSLSLSLSGFQWVAMKELYGERFQKGHSQQTSSCEGV